MGEEKMESMGMHLKELRKVLVYSVLAVLVGTVVCYGFFMQDIMGFVTAPIENLGFDLKFIGVSEAFMAHIKIAVLAGFILGFPIVCWQFMSFILPALYKNERRIFYVLLFFSLVLFVGGIAFAYFFVLKWALKALLITFAGDLVAEITASYYISFVLKFLVPFGVVFEIPLFVYFLTKVGIITPDFLKKNRKYVILIMLVGAAMLTPPDIVSQAMLATPMYLLYEISIVISKGVYRRRQKKLAKLEMNSEEIIDENSEENL